MEKLQRMLTDMGYDGEGFIQTTTAESDRFRMLGYTDNGIKYFLHQSWSRKLRRHGYGDQGSKYRWPKEVGGFLLEILPQNTALMDDLSNDLCRSYHQKNALIYLNLKIFADRVCQKPTAPAQIALPVAAAAAAATTTAAADRRARHQESFTQHQQQAMTMTRPPHREYASQRHYTRDDSSTTTTTSRMNYRSYTMQPAYNRRHTVVPTIPQLSRGPTFLASDVRNDYSFRSHSHSRDGAADRQPRRGEDVRIAIDDEGSRRSRAATSSRGWLWGMCKAC